MTLSLDLSLRQLATVDTPKVERGGTGAALETGAVKELELTQ